MWIGLVSRIPASRYSNRQVAVSRSSIRRSFINIDRVKLWIYFISFFLFGWFSGGWREGEERSETPPSIRQWEYQWRYHFPFPASGYIKHVISKEKTTISTYYIFKNGQATLVEFNYYPSKSSGVFFQTCIVLIMCCSSTLYTHSELDRAGARRCVVEAKRLSEMAVFVRLPLRQVGSQQHMV